MLKEKNFEILDILLMNHNEKQNLLRANYR